MTDRTCKSGHCGRPDPYVGYAVAGTRVYYSTDRDKAPVPAGYVPEELERLQNAVSALDAELCVLQGRLELVLAPSTDHASDGSGDTAPCSPLAKNLGELADRVFSMTRGLRYTMGRLDF